MTPTEKAARRTPTSTLLMILAQHATDVAKVFCHSEEAIRATKAEIDRRFPIPEDEEEV